MLINFFKIFFSILLIIYQIPVYSKNNYINEFNYKDLSNYFSAKVSYGNQKNADSLKFFKFIQEKHHDRTHPPQCFSMAGSVHF